jgi:Tfp pilus assembly protein PilO
MATDRMQALQDRLTDLLHGLSPRDRVLLAGLVVFLLTGMTFGVVAGMKGSLDSNRNRLADRKMQLALAEEMVGDYEQGQERSVKIEAEMARHSGTDLSAFLEQAAQRAGVRDKLASVKEKGTTNTGFLEEKLYAVNVDKLSQTEMTDLLHEIETAGYPLTVRNTKIKVVTRSGERLLNLSMDIAAYRSTTTTESEG